MSKRLTHAAAKGNIIFAEFTLHDLLILSGIIPVIITGPAWNPYQISKWAVKGFTLGLNDYIPFHFHPYSAFDVAVKRNHPNEEMIYICITRALARENDFKILPKHPLALEDYQLYSYDDGFNRIDWGTMMQTGLTDEEAKHVKMAECLSHLVIPVEKALIKNVSGTIANYDPFKLI